MGRDIALVIKGQVDNAEQQIRQLQRTGSDVASILERQFENLGTKSNMVFERQRTAAVSEYERIKNSGIASAAEIQRAFDAMQSKVLNLDIQMNPAGLSAAESEILQLQAAGTAVTDRLSMDFERLGLRSSAAIAESRASIVASLERIKSSGVATAAEIARATEAANVKLTHLGHEEPTGLMGWLQKARNGLFGMGDGMDHAAHRGNILESTLMSVMMKLSMLYMAVQMFVMPLERGFMKGVDAVDEFQQSVIQTSAIITSLQGGNDVAENYRKAKDYAGGLNEVLMQVDARTTLNLQNLQVITEEMIKQGVVLDYTNAAQVEGFTRLANAVAVYSRNGADERQVRQETKALLMGQVDANSQLASITQRMVDGPLKQQVEQWKASGTFLAQMGDKLAGFGPASADMANTWSAVKSSLETAVTLVLRAGFTDIVKEVSEWLGRVNEYLKSHRDLIGKEIREGWETFKTLAGAAAAAVKFVWENFEPFAAVIVGGAIVSGVFKIVSAFEALKKIVIEVRAAMIAMSLVSAGATAAGAATAGGAAVAGGAAAAGGMALGTGLAIGGGVLAAGGLLGYGLQPAVRWADRKLYQNFGWNLTGQAFYEEQTAKEQEADARLAEVTARRAQQRGLGASIPQLKLQDSPEIQSEKSKFFDKELAAYKEMQDGKEKIARSSAELELARLKGQYDQGLVSTREFYEEEARVAENAAIDEYNAALDYLNKFDAKRKDFQNRSALEYLEAMKGKGSPEYQEELKKREAAVTAVELAENKANKSALEGNNKVIEALRSREQEYYKLKEAALDSAGAFDEAENMRQEAYRKSSDYLKLEADALSGSESAWGAMMALEKKEAEDTVAAQIKKSSAVRQYAEETAKMQDQLDTVLGKDAEMIKSAADLRAGLATQAELQEKIRTAWANGNTVAITALSQQIQMQDELNRRLAASKTLLEQQAVLQGKIVGFSDGKPIYSNEGGMFNNGTSVNPYQSPSGSASPFAPVNQLSSSNIFGNSPFVDIYGNSLAGARADGGPVAPFRNYLVGERGPEIVRIGSQGGTVIPNAKGITITGGISLSLVLPNVRSANEIDYPKVARRLKVELDNLDRRKRA